MEQHFSPARVGRYRAARGGDATLASADYSRNMLLAEAMLPMLNVLEIGLRNAVHGRLKQLYRRDDWWEVWAVQPEFDKVTRVVADAKQKLKQRRERATPDKILAELTFGFWCMLFNVKYQHLLWKDLRLAFPACPRDQRQRHTLSSALNRVRELRNRVFHHEPLLWLTPDLYEQHGKGVTLVRWLDPNLARWLGRHDRLPVIWATEELAAKRLPLE